MLGRTELFSVKPYVTVSREKVMTGSGVVIDDFYQVDLSVFSVCVPVLTNGEVAMRWEYKHGARRCGFGFPAGLVEENESPESACRRELLEETGLIADRVVALGTYADNGNQRGSVGHYFLAHACRKVAVPIADAFESAEMHFLTPQAVDRALLEGKFSVIHHVAAWALARPQL